jgi:hypothetical protein
MMIQPRVKGMVSRSMARCLPNVFIRQPVNKQEIVLPMLRAEAIQARSLEVIPFSVCSNGLAGEVQPKTAP